MKTRLALVAFRDAGEGPWIRPRGNETGVRVQYLGEGERICMVMVIEDVNHHESFDRAGVFELPKGWSKLRFVKMCEGEGKCHTQVDLLVA